MHKILLTFTSSFPLPLSLTPSPTRSEAKLKMQLKLGYRRVWQLGGEGGVVPLGNELRSIANGPHLIRGWWQQEHAIVRSLLHGGWYVANKREHRAEQAGGSVFEWPTPLGIRAMRKMKGLSTVLLEKYRGATNANTLRHCSFECPAGAPAILKNCQY